MAQKNIIWTTAFGTLALAYIAKPDDKAPEGASFKPDGKFKGTLVFEDGAAVEQMRADCIAMIRAAHPEAAKIDEDQFALPIKPGEALGGKKAETFAGKVVLEAKSQFRPGVFDSQGAKCPEGVYAYSGDIVRFKVAPYVFKKTEKVRENGKMIDVDLFGVSLRLSSVQIKKKGGGGGGGFDAVEDGEFDGSTAEPRQERAARTERSAGKAAGSDGDF
jgi:hypothetical protein